MRRPEPRRIKANGATRLAEAQAQLERPAPPPPAFRTTRWGTPDEKGKLPLRALCTPINPGFRVEADSGAAYVADPSGALVRKDKIRGLRKKDRRKIRAKRRAEIQDTEGRILELQGELAAIEAELQTVPAAAEVSA